MNEINYRKDVLLNTIGNFAYLGTLWLISIVVVRLSGFEDAGRLAVAMTSANLYISLASYTVRLYYAADINKKFSDSQYILMRCITTTLSIVLCIGVSILVGYSTLQIQVIFLFYIYKSEEMLSDILFGVLQRNGKLYLCGYSLTLKSILSLISFVLILYFTKSLILALSIISLIGALVLIFLDYPMVCKVSESKIQFKNEDWTYAFKLIMICLPLFIVGLCYNFIPSVPRLIFERMYTSEEMGFYSSISTITVLISTAVTCILTPLIPKFSLYYWAGRKKNLIKLTFYSVGAILGFGLICLLIERLLGLYVLVLLFGEAIAPYAYIFKWIIIATILTSEIICINNFFVASNEQKTLMFAAIIGAIFCAILSIPLCKYYYMLGVTLSLIIAQLVEIALMIIAMRKILKKMPDTEYN